MTLRPLPDDPDRDVIASMMDLANDEWLLTAAGDYSAAAGETMKKDGSDYQRLVMLEWPARVNKTQEHRTVRLLISPEDALGLCDVLAHTARFLLRETGA